MSSQGDPSRNGNDHRDLDLLERLRASDATAFDELLQLYWRPLVTYAVRLLPVPHGAEDVAQEVFISLWERRASLVATTPLRPLLYRIAHNIALNRRRGWRVREEWRLAGPAEPHGGCETPLQAALDHELQSAVHGAIRALPPRRREAFVLARFHDMSYRQIATIMGVSTQTVANHICGALTELRHALAPYLEP